MAVRRGFGIAADSVAGGSSYDDNGGATPDATEFWPITGGSLDKGIARIDRNDEVRGRRAGTPPVSFRAEPSMTVPLPAYLSIWARIIALAFGKTYTPTGTAPAAVTHALRPVEYGVDTLPKQVHCQMIRDAHNHKLQGASINNFSLNFPMDGEGAGEVGFQGLYQKDDPGAIPSISFSGISARPLVLRDAQVFKGGATEVQTATIGGAPSGGTFTLTIPANTVGVPTGTTSALAFDAAAAAVQAALEVIVGTGNVTVTGSAGGPYTITFAGTYTGRPVPTLTANAASLTPSGTVTIATTTQGGDEIPDLQGFEFSFNNNLAPKPYAKRNRVVDGTDILWYPEIRKLGAMQEVTSRLIFGNTNTAEEVKHDFAKYDRAVFEVEGPAAGTTPAANELMRITLYAAVATDGGPEGLSARDDITANYEYGAFHSESAAGDVLVEVVNARSTSYLAAGL